MIQNINHQRAMKLAAEKDAVLVDIRDPVRFRDYHVEGSEFYSLRNVGTLRKYTNQKCPFVLVFETQDQETLRSFYNYMLQFEIDPKRIYGLKLD